MENQLFEDVRQVICEYIQSSEKIDVSDIHQKSRLLEDLGLDSFDMAEVAVLIEDETGKTISCRSIVDMETVGDIITYLEQQ